MHVSLYQFLVIHLKLDEYCCVSHNETADGNANWHLITTASSCVQRCSTTRNPAHALDSQLLTAARYHCPVIDWYLWLHEISHLWVQGILTWGFCRRVSP